MIAAAIALVVLMVPIVLIFVGRPPVLAHTAATAAADAPSSTQIRARAFRDIGFLSVSAAFALVLFAQVGFIVHLISFLDSVTGRERAAIAVALLTAMAVVGRVLFSFVIDRMNQRLASALSFISQAVALVIIINVHNDIVLIAACALFGFSVGNLITLPALIVQREFDPRSFGVLISLITAINQITYAFGPGVVGAAARFFRQLCAAVLLLYRDRADRGGADHDPRARSRSSRSSRFVNIESLPSGARGHSSCGRSRYSSTPFSSGSRRYSASLTPWSLAPSSWMPALITRCSASASAGRVG